MTEEHVYDYHNGETHEIVTGPDGAVTVDRWTRLCKRCGLKLVKDDPAIDWSCPECRWPLPIET